MTAVTAFRQRHRNQHHLAIREDGHEQRNHSHIQEERQRVEDGRPLGNRHRGSLQPTQRVCRNRFVLSRATLVGSAETIDDCLIQ
jgi:hypothetical protein